MILACQKIEKAFGGKSVLNNVNFLINEGEKAAVIGINGAGKTTLFKIITGEYEADNGEVIFQKGSTYGYLSQVIDVSSHRSIYEEMLDAKKEIIEMEKKIRQLEKDISTLSGEALESAMESYSRLTDRFEKANGYAWKSEITGVLKGLGFDESQFATPIHTLSGGQKTRVALSRILLMHPDLILLDEPTNHLDMESIRWLETFLSNYRGAVLIVSHDRYFLDHVAGWILELDRGEGIPWKGNYSSWLEQKTQRMALEEKQASKRRKTLEHELEWINMAPKARQAKGKARLKSYETLLNEDQKERETKLEIFIPNGPRLGNKVIEAQHVAKAFGSKLLFDDLNFTLPPNGIVGVIGPNGAGKTTLFKMILGMESIDKGTFEVGQTVRIGYADQTHKDIDPKKTVYQVISGGQESIRVGGREINARAYLSRFNFSGADQEKQCGVLSGGERNRLHLALTLKADANVLLLDEPTNDIDVNTLRALEEGLENFAGCAVVVSHDRWFLVRICTNILSFEGDSNVVFYEGTYSEYEEHKRAQLGDIQPKRVRYRKLIAD